MLFLIAPLLFIGSFSTSHSVEVVKNKLDGHLITLRDYDFVGEDKRLSELLAERMAVLQKPLNLSDIEAMEATEDDNITKGRPELDLKPDHLQLNLRRYPRVNVSLDYAELFNASDLSFDANASWLAPAVSAAALNYSTHLRQAGNLTAGRRAPVYWDPSFYQYNLKILDIMKQNIYSVQGKLIEVEPIMQKYQSDPRFRIAYIYSRLEEWKKDLRTLYFAMKKPRYAGRHLRFKRLIWYYEHALRRNIDITYSIEFLIYLHTEYMEKMEGIMPASQRAELMEMQKQKEKMKNMQANMMAPANMFPHGR